MIILFIKKHMHHYSHPEEAYSTCITIPIPYAISSQKNSNASGICIAFHHAGAGMGEKILNFDCPTKPKDSASDFMHSTKYDLFQKLLSLQKHRTF